MQDSSCGFLLRVWHKILYARMKLNVRKGTSQESCSGAKVHHKRRAPPLRQGANITSQIIIVATSVNWSKDFRMGSAATWRAQSAEAPKPQMPGVIRPVPINPITNLMAMLARELSTWTVRSLNGFGMGFGCVAPDSISVSFSSRTQSNSPIMSLNFQWRRRYSPGCFILFTRTPFQMCFAF
jgi:hypothetical protein